MDHPVDIDETLPEEGPPAEFDVYSVVLLHRPSAPPPLPDDLVRRPEADPVVRAGLFRVDVLRWLTAKGALVDGVSRLD